jgi:hypothetical protein
MCNGVQSHLAPPFQQSIPPLVLRASSGSSLLGMKQYALRKSFKSPYISSTTTEECQRKSSFSDTHTNPDYCLCLILSGPPAAGSVSPCALAFSMSSTIFFPFNIPRRLSSTLDMMNSAAAGKFAPIVAGHTYPYHYTHASAYSIHSPHYTPPPDLLRYYYLGNPRSLSPLSKLRQKLSWTNLRQRTSQWRRYKSRTNAVHRYRHTSSLQPLAHRSRQTHDPIFGRGVKGDIITHVNAIYAARHGDLPDPIWI